MADTISLSRLVVNKGTMSSSSMHYEEFNF